jgi:hypothetical protein
MADVVASLIQTFSLAFVLLATHVFPSNSHEGLAMFSLHAIQDLALPLVHHQQYFPYDAVNCKQSIVVHRTDTVAEFAH